MLGSQNGFSPEINPHRWELVSGEPLAELPEWEPGNYIFGDYVQHGGTKYRFLVAPYGQSVSPRDNPDMWVKVDESTPLGK